MAVRGSVRSTVRASIHDARAEARREEELLEAARGLRMAWAQGISTLYKVKSLTGESRDHTLDIIENSRIYFSSPDQFNDPFDCAPPFKLAGDPNDPEFVKELQRDEARAASASGMTAEQLEVLRSKQGVPVEVMPEAARENTLRELRKDTRVLCLASEQRHPLMWSHYASSHSGVCLHFNCGSGALFGLARQVLYVPERKPVLLPLYKQNENEITERLVLEKADYWKYESEYRVIGHQTADWGYAFDAKGRVAFSPEHLCGITLGVRISDPDRTEVLALASQHDPPITVWRAYESPNRFWVDLERIQ